MKLFFGKISHKIDKNQITEGYYRAIKDSIWFNGLKRGDFSNIIGGNKIQYTSVSTNLLFFTKEEETHSSTEILDMLHKSFRKSDDLLSQLKKEIGK